MTSGEYLTPKEREVLELIESLPAQLTLRDIATHLHSTPGSVKVLVRRLRIKGHRITTPILLNRGAPRKGVPQVYSIDPTPITSER